MVTAKVNDTTSCRLDEKPLNIQQFWDCFWFLLFSPRRSSVVANEVKYLFVLMEAIQKIVLQKCRQSRFTCQLYRARTRSEFIGNEVSDSIESTLYRKVAYLFSIGRENTSLGLILLTYFCCVFLCSPEPKSAHIFPAFIAKARRP